SSDSGLTIKIFNATRTSPLPFERGCSSPIRHTDSEIWRLDSSAMNKVTIVTTNEKSEEIRDS
ncbi:unnamed protein product, partial [Heterotrigona itama]